MRIALSADNSNGIDSVISPHFGRCPHFVVVDVDGQTVNEVSVVDNPFYGNHQPGQVPGFIRQLGADVMLTGGMGARAVMFFQQFGIEPVTGASGTARMSLEAYLGGALQGAAPCAQSEEHHHGDMPAEGEYEKDELGRLREEIESLESQLDDASSRLNKLGGA